MILTSKHLAVIRAALEYWHDEMSPHDPSLYTAYFDEPIGNGKWINEIVAELRTGLPMCQLRYVLCSPEGTTVVGHQLLESHDEAQRAVPDGSALIATVLIGAIGSLTGD